MKFNAELSLWIFLSIKLASCLRDITSPDMVGPIWGPGSGCRRQLEHLQGSFGVEIIQPPQVRGEWVSTRCEVRPGPEFLVRRYKFHADAFTLHQFYYSDHQCQNPSHSFRIRGNIKIGRPSLIQEGASNVEYQLERVVLIIYDANKLDFFSEHLNLTCMRSIIGNEYIHINIYERYTILHWSNANDVFADCTESLRFTAHELQLIRQQIVREFKEKEAREVEWEELFVGDIHTDPNLRAFHRPRSLQEALRKYKMTDQDCAVCQIVFDGDEHSPPILPTRHELVPAPLRGQWVSSRCEVRSANFLTRLLTFYANNTWEAHYHYYNDARCLHAIYTLSVKGTHTPPIASTQVKGGTATEFTAIGMFLTPQDKTTVKRLNSISEGLCGKHGRWRLGATIDVTFSGGCLTLGAIIPYTEYQLIRIEVDPLSGLLFFNGQRPTDGEGPNSVKRRPSSYQTPLVHCEGEDPRTSASLEPGDAKGHVCAFDIYGLSLALILSIFINL